MKIAVIIPTYNRPAHIDKCIDSLMKQHMAPDEIIAVVRPDDEATRKILEKHRATASAGTVIKILEVTMPGIVHAENAGLRAAKEDIVCFIDDDAIAPEHWIDGIMRHYERDPTVGGVGGPVVLVIDGKPVIEYTDTFARMTWFGRRITNSTKIPLKVQEVDMLRGANMSFRRRALSGFDERLLPYWRRFEDDACFSVKAQGYKLICDPALAVRHFEAVTHVKMGIDRTPETILGLHHNSMYVKLKHCKGIGKLAAILYEFAWGDITSPGFFHILGYGIKNRSGRSFYELSYAMAGKWKGIITYCRFILSRKPASGEPDGR